MSLVAYARDLLQRDDWVILDTETTGKEPYSDELVEIAIIDHKGTVLLNSLIKPLWPIPVRATDIHSITNEMVQQEDAPLFSEIFPRIVRATQDKTVITYNAWFDISFLESLAERHELGDLSVKSWCLMEAYAEFWGETRWNGKYKSS
jgi:DNA polymerase-3 subunit epsilon